MNYLNFKCDINITDNTLGLDINDFLEVGIRNNNKRRFLFISKTLGKHLACKPTDVDDLGKLIVSVYNKKGSNLNKGTVISFAETATCIGHSVFDYLDGDYEFIHTTREKIHGLKSLDFLETHSHATNHNLYYEKLSNLKDSSEVILVDDEITTANTCLNLIREINSIYPKEKYTICSIFNWIGEENLVKVNKLEKELNCKIEFIYLFKGSFEFSIDEKTISNVYNKQELDNNIYNKLEPEICCDLDNSNELIVEYIDLDLDDYIENNKYTKYSGIVGLNKLDQKKLKKIIRRESEKLDVEGKTLFLGTEEFMYIPMLFAKEKEKFGDIQYYSTTRSPIIEFEEKDYPIKSKYKHSSFYNSDVVNYLYNIDKNDFSECFLFVEVRNEKEQYSDLIDIFKKTSIKKLNIVCCS